MVPLARPQIPAASHAPAERETRVRRLLAEHFDFIWRLLRRLGLSADQADDSAQQVFLVASQKLTSIEPERERSFLYGTAMRVASDLRRSAPVRREVPRADAGAELESGLMPDSILEQRRARELLDAALLEMELELRSVFVLFEMEEMTLTEISDLLEIPRGTVASRLRRARDEFTSHVKNLQRARRTPARTGGER